MRLVTELFEDKHLENQIQDFKLIPATGGKFEVVVNDELIFSKKALGRHAEPGEVYQLIKAKLD